MLQLWVEMWFFSVLLIWEWHFSDSLLFCWLIHTCTKLSQSYSPPLQQANIYRQCTMRCSFFIFLMPSFFSLRKYEHGKSCIRALSQASSHFSLSLTQAVPFSGYAQYHSWPGWPGSAALPSDLLTVGKLNQQREGGTMEVVISWAETSKESKNNCEEYLTSSQLRETSEQTLCKDKVKWVILKCGLSKKEKKKHLAYELWRLHPHSCP